MHGGNGPAAKSGEAAFISEVFHTLSQPLTALHCTLELALQRDDTLEQLRASVQTALDNAERLRGRLLLVRALNDAETSVEEFGPTDLAALLRELHEHLSPLFESTGRRFELALCNSPFVVQADVVRLRRAWFVFVEYLYRYLPEGGALSLELRQNARQDAEIYIASESCLPVSPADVEGEGNQACEIELLRRTIAATRGELVLVDQAPDRSLWLARLPCSE